MKPLLEITAFVLIFAQFALAGAEDTYASSGAVVLGDNEPSINPDSFFWGFKDAFDKFSLALTFDSEAKAKKSITIAEERLREFEKMAEEGNLEAAKKAKESHDDFIERAKSAAKDISEGNKTEEIEKQIEIESDVEELENRTEIITGRLKIKIETEGNLTAEQKALIDSFIASMQNQTGSLKIEIKQNKEKIKIEIKQRTNKTDDEIEDEIEEIEREHNITDSGETKRGDANEKILEAKEEITSLMDEIEIYNVTDNAVLVLRDNSIDKLAGAEEAFGASRYGEAYGFANAAKNMAENGREKIEKLGEKEEDLESKDEIKREIVGLCETENPGFNASDECEKIISNNYSNFDCSFELGPISWLPQGSCRNCTIECKAEKQNVENKGTGHEGKEICAQVITPAKNEKTGECKEFATPCDVPDSWEKVEKCT